MNTYPKNYIIKYQNNLIVMNNPWNINLVTKRECINKNVIGIFIQKPDISPICKYKIIGIKNSIVQYVIFNYF